MHLAKSHSGRCDRQSPVLYSFALPGAVTIAPIGISFQLNNFKPPLQFVRRLSDKH